MNKGKPGWVYFDWKPLGEGLALHEETGWVFCEDKTRYSPQELDIVEKADAVITASVHCVKKILGGEIIEIRK